MKTGSWLAFAIAACLSGVIGAQAPSPPMPSGSGNTTISGIVIERASRRPMAGAVVSLYSVPARAARVQFEGEGAPPDLATWFQTSAVLTGADGRFRFPGVPQGSYELNTWKAGWLAGAWESVDPQLTGDWMAISPATRTAEVTVPLEPAPVVRGRVVDENGDPVMYVLVRGYYRDLYARNRVWQELGTRRTDDRGMFGMMSGSGDFVFRVQPPTLQSGRTVTPMQTRLLRLRPGEIRDLDFRLERVPAYRVSGQLVGVQNLANVFVRLIPVDAGEQIDPYATDLVATIRSDGRFAFAPAPAGRYVLRAIEAKSLPTSSHGIVALDELPTDPTLAAERAVDLADRDVDLTIPLQLGVRISGRVEFDGEASPQALANLKRIAISLQSVDDARIDLRGLFSSNKTFITMQVPPGRYVMRTWGPQGWMLRSIVHSGKDIADEPLEVGSADVADVVITFTSRQSFLSGDVAGAAAKHRRPWVIAFPSDQRLWTQVWTTPRRVAIARVGTAGTFEFPLVAGGYFLCAVDERPVALTPDVFKELESRAVPVFVSEGDRLTQSVPWSPGVVRR